MASTNLNLLNQAAAQGGSYSDFLNRLAAGGGLEGQEANAIIKAGLYTPQGVMTNMLANTGVNGLGDYGSAHALNPVYGQESGQVESNGANYGPLGLSKLNSIYFNAYSGANNNDTAGFGGSTSSYDPAVLAQYDQSINQLNSALGRLPSQLDIARGNIGKQFDTNLNELNSAKQQAQNSFDTQSTQNAQNLRTNKNVIADQASSGLRGLLRMLGAYGAGGSSDALYVAPQAVVQQANQQRAGAGQVFSQNAQSLDTNFNNFLGQDENSRKRLNDWRTQQLNSAEAQSLASKQDLLSKIANAQGARAAYRGGSFSGAAQPFLDQANALSGQIDDLGRINPTYNGTTPVYQAPSLDSFSASRPVSAQMDMSNQSAYSPLLSLLLNGQRDKNKVTF